MNTKARGQLASDLNRSLRSLLTTALRRRELDYEAVRGAVQVADAARGNVPLACGALLRFLEQAGVVELPPAEE